MKTESMMVPLGQAARQLGVSPDTLRRWHRQGHLIAIKLKSGRYLVPISEVRRLARGR